MNDILYIKKKDKVSLFSLFILFNILILPIFDNISGVLFKLNLIGDGSIGSPSQLGRFIGILFVIFLIFQICTLKTKKISLFILFYFILIESFSSLFYRELFPYLYGLVNALKIIYAFLCILLLTDLVNQNKINSNLISKYIIIYGTIISILVISSYLSGFYIANYSKGIATRGLFISGNGLGVVIGISSLVLLYNIQRISFLSLLHILVLIITIALIGTKAALLFLIINILYFAYKLFKRNPLIFSSLSFVIFYFLWSLIFERLEMIFENIIFKFENIDNKFILLASSRDLFIIDAFNKVNWDGLYSIRVIFGAGSYFAYLDPAIYTPLSRKLLENDLFELFFSYGGVALLFYVLLYFLALYKGIINKNYFYLFIFSLVFLHSITVGHVLFNGTSSIMLGFTFALLYCKKSLT